MTYYKDETFVAKGKPQAAISINSQCKVLPTVEKKKIRKKRPNAFCLETPSRTYYLDCEDNQIKSNWLYNLRKTVDMAKKLQQENQVAYEAKVKRLSQVSQQKPRVDSSDDDEVDNDDKFEDSDETDRSTGKKRRSSSHSSTAAGPTAVAESKDAEVPASDEKEARIQNTLAQPVIWNRFNETNRRPGFSQVEFGITAVNMYAPSQRRTSNPRMVSSCMPRRAIRIRLPAGSRTRRRRRCQDSSSSPGTTATERDQTGDSPQGNRSASRC